MDTRAQMQAIVDRLAGIPFEEPPPVHTFDQPWRTIYHRVTRAIDQAEAASLIWQATERLGDHEARLQWMTDLVVLLPGDDRFRPFPSLREMSAGLREVEWLWPSWIPRGMVSLFGAAPGAGKSLVALDLARRIIHGEPFPDGAPVPCPGSNVLIVDAEGTPALLNQRARAWNIDRDRLFLMVPPRTSILIDLDDLPQQKRLVEMCARIQPSLVVVDSLAAATARSETSLQGARFTLAFLSTLAEAMNLALLVIHHLRKRSSSSASASRPVVAGDLRGSTHLSAAARSVLALSNLGVPPAPPLEPTAGPPSDDLASTEAASADPALEGSAPADSAAPTALTPPAQSLFDSPRRLEVVKTNLCRHPPPLALTFEGQDAPAPVLHYTQLVEPPPQPTRVDLCAHWLLQFLTDAGEPVKPADAIRAAHEAGFPRPTLYRARQALSSLVVDLGAGPHDPRKRWTLAQAQPSPDEST